LAIELQIEGLILAGIGAALEVWGLNGIRVLYDDQDRCADRLVTADYKISVWMNLDHRRCHLLCRARLGVADQAGQ
jgi:hypothetical protein